jgi:mannose-6-phosphate isomerase
MGAHPNAPSRSKARGLTLGALIEADPLHELGATTSHAFGPRLPFLLKVLAADQPLSLQSHPNAEQARAGFDDEEKRGIPRDAPNRNYKDRSHKPELLCALGPFDALSGFRPIEDTIRLFDLLAVAELDGVLAPLAQRDLAETFRRVMTADPSVVAHVVAACARPSPHFAPDRALACRLQQIYPNDIGILSALLLEHVHLEAGDAIYLDAGNLHAYLGGVGVEIMASSDNVLRGGLTPKHVDVPELMKCLHFAAEPTPILKPREVDACEGVYDTPAKEFRLSVLKISTPIARDTIGPEILLTTEGSVQASGSEGGVSVPRGSSVFIPASTGRYTLEGDGIVYRATTNL